MIHGGAKGADQCAVELWRKTAFPVELFRAEWDREGRRAGMIRNTRMLDYACSLSQQGIPVVVHAFPMPCTQWNCSRQGLHNSHGTMHMINAVRHAGLPVTSHGTSEFNPESHIDGFELEL